MRYELITCPISATRTKQAFMDARTQYGWKKCFIANTVCPNPCHKHEMKLHSLEFLSKGKDIRSISHGP